MRGFLFAVVGYCAVSMALVAVLFGDIAALLATAAVATGDFARMLGFSALWALPVIAVLPITIGRDAFRRRLAATTYAFLGCILLPVAFSFTKSSIPAIVPFYADPALAGFDRWLHGGTDPWTLSHGLAGNWPMAPLLDLYLYVWTIPATALPVLIALTDPDPVRSRRFVQLYLFVWLGLGSVGAIAFSSVGPVYYDALVGGDRFAALTAALADGAVGASFVGQVQGALWQNYESGAMAIGLGISAFPSVHVAIAALTALYMAERLRALRIPGLAFVVIVQFLSVYTGYHYAVDGYASIVAVVAVWALLRWRVPRPAPVRHGFAG